MTEAERRKAFQANNALSQSESRDIMRVFDTMIQIRITELSVNKETLETKAGAKITQLKASEACEICKVDPKRLQRIYSKLSRINYWSYFITDVTIKSDKSVQAKYQIFKNGESYKEYTAENINLAKHDYSNNPLKVAEAIGLTDYLYVSYREYTALQSLIFSLNREAEEEAGKKAFYLLKSSPVLQSLAISNHAIDSELSKPEDELSEGYEGKYYTFQSGNLRIIAPVKEYNEYGKSLFLPYTRAFLDLVNIIGTRDNWENKTIRISLNEYKDLRGLTDRKSAWDQMKRAGNNLYYLSVEYTGNSAYEFEKQRLIQKVKGSGGKGRPAALEITLTDDFYEHAKGVKSALWYPDILYRLDITHYPNADSLARYFCDNARINAGKQTQRRTAKITTLLKHTSYNYSKLKDKGQAKQLIIDPFFRTLEYLKEQGLLLDYSLHFANKNEAEQIISYEDISLRGYEKDYKTFIKFSIDYTFTEEIEAKLSAQESELEDRKAAGRKALKKKRT